MVKKGMFTFDISIIFNFQKLGSVGLIKQKIKLPLPNNRINKASIF